MGKQNKALKLLRDYSKAMDALLEAGIVRTRNNPVGDYAEWVVKEELNLKLEKNSKSGYDATDKKGIRYQIKGRRVTSKNKSRQLGVIRDLNEKKFDFLVAVIFDEQFNVIEAYKIPHKIIKNHSKYSEHQHGHLVHLKGEILKDKLTQKIEL